MVMADEHKDRTTVYETAHDLFVSSAAQGTFKCYLSAGSCGSFTELLLFCVYVHITK